MVGFGALYDARNTHLKTASVFAFLRKRKMQSAKRKTT